MIGNIFYYVLNMSIMAAFITVVLLLFRGILGKWLPKYVAYFLWGIILIRLWIPVAVQSKASLIHLLNHKYVKIIPLIDPSVSLPQTSMSNTLQSVNNYFPLTYKNEVLEYFFKLSGLIWLIGVVLLLVLFVSFYYVTSIQLKRSTKLKKPNNLYLLKKQLRMHNKVEIYQHSTLTTPLVFGVLRPRILLPMTASIKNLDYILLHELVHIKRHDNLWKLISIVTVCIHWFNPFAWLFLYFSGRDAELACDEKVLNIIGLENKKEYAQTLANLTAGQNLPVSAFGNTATKIRILSIITSNKITLWMVFLSFAFCALCALMLLTNP